VRHLPFTYDPNVAELGPATTRDLCTVSEALKKEAFEKATWDFLGFVLGRTYNVVSSMSKARNAGWTGYKDT
jgi:hypothetical protein